MSHPSMDAISGSDRQSSSSRLANTRASVMTTGSSSTGGTHRTSYSSPQTNQNSFDIPEECNGEEIANQVSTTNQRSLRTHSDGFVKQTERRLSGGPKATSNGRKLRKGGSPNHSNRVTPAETPFILPTSVNSTPRNPQLSNSFQSGDPRSSQMDFGLRQYITQQQHQQQTMSVSDGYEEGSAFGESARVKEKWIREQNSKQLATKAKESRKKHLKELGLDQVVCSPSLKTVAMFLITLVSLFALSCLAPIFLLGRPQLLTTVEKLRKEFRLHVKEQSKGVFLRPQAAMKSWMSMNDVGLFGDLRNFNELAPSMKKIADDLNRTTTAVYYGLHSDGAFNWVHGTSNESWRVFPSNSSSMGFEMDLTVPYFPLVGNATPWEQSSYDPRARPWYATLYARNAWSEVYLNYGRDLEDNFAVITFGGPLRNAQPSSPTSNAPLGVAGIDIITKDVQKFLVSSASIAGGTGRVIILDPSNHRILGANWESFVSVVIVNGNWTHGTRRLTELEDLGPGGVYDDGNGLVGEGIKRFGIPNLISASSTSSSASSDLPKSYSWGSFRNQVFVEVDSLQDSAGLDLRLIIFVPMNRFFDGVVTIYIIFSLLAVVIVLVLWMFSYCILTHFIKPLEEVPQKLRDSTKYQSELASKKKANFIESQRSNQEKGSFVDVATNMSNESTEERDQSSEHSASHRHGVLGRICFGPRWFYVKEVESLELAYLGLKDEVEAARNYIPRSLLVSRSVQRRDFHLNDDRTSQEEEQMATETASDMEKVSAQARRVRYHQLIGSGGGIDDRGSEFSAEMMATTSSVYRTAGIPNYQTTVSIKDLRFRADPQSSSARRVSHHSISVLFVNVRQFNLLSAKQSKHPTQRTQRSQSQTKNPAHEAMEVHRAYLEACVDTSEKFGGCIDSYVGDHVLLTFNVISSLADHRNRAAAAALHLINTCKESKLLQKDQVGSKPETSRLLLTIGMASSEALVGEFGGAGTRRFTATGPCISHAAILERYCKRFRIHCLAPEDFVKGLGRYFAHMAVDALLLPFPKSPQFVSVHTVYNPNTHYPPGFHPSSLLTQFEQHSVPRQGNGGMKPSVSESSLAMDSDSISEGLTPKTGRRGLGFRAQSTNSTPVLKHQPGAPHLAVLPPPPNSHAALLSALSTSVAALNLSWSKIVTGDPLSAAHYLTHEAGAYSELVGWQRLREVLRMPVQGGVRMKSFSPNASLTGAYNANGSLTIMPDPLGGQGRTAAAIASQQHQQSAFSSCHSTWRGETGGEERSGNTTPVAGQQKVLPWMNGAGNFSPSGAESDQVPPGSTVLSSAPMLLPPSAGVGSSLHDAPAGSTFPPRTAPTPPSRESIVRSAGLGYYEAAYLDETSTFENAPVSHSQGLVYFQNTGVTLEGSANLSPRTPDASEGFGTLPFDEGKARGTDPLVSAFGEGVREFSPREVSTEGERSDAPREFEATSRVVVG